MPNQPATPAVEKLDVVTLGETMVRFSPPGMQRLEQARLLEVAVGGAESNLAVALSRLGMKVGWISKLVDNPLGHLIANELRSHGVDLSRVVWQQEGRVGIYFIELARYPRPIHVTYDRAGSAACQLRVEDVDWDYLCAARAVHLTGITPALSPDCRRTVLETIRRASDAGVLISFDVNYRAKLWSYADAAKFLQEALPHVDIFFSPLRDMQRLLDFDGDASQAAGEVQSRFGVRVVVVTRGEESSLALGDKLYEGMAIKATPIDRVGAGDAFAGGFLFGYLNGDIQAGLRYGGAMAALKHTIPGDLALFTREEVEALIAQKGQEIQR